MPMLSWKGKQYDIPATTIGSAKQVAKMRKQLASATASGDDEAVIESVAQLLGLMGCPQEVADTCPLVEIMPLVEALAEAQAITPATGGGGTGNEPSPTEGESSASTTP